MLKKYITPLPITFIILLISSIRLLLGKDEGGWGLLIAAVLTGTAFVLLLVHFILFFYLREKRLILWIVELIIVALLVLYGELNHLISWNHIIPTF